MPAPGSLSPRPDIWVAEYGPVGFRLLLSNSNKINAMAFASFTRI